MPRDKRSSPNRGVGVLPWLMGEPIVSDSDGRVGFCRVPEREEQFFDSLVSDFFGRNPGRQQKSAKIELCVIR